MNTQPSSSVSSPALWQWPIDFSAYDCRPALTPTEEETIDRLVTLIQRNHTWPQRRLRRDLDRLLHPIRDALTVAELGIERWSPVENALLVQMHARHTSLWGWTAAEWEETLVQWLDKPLRYPTSIVAYLLGNIRDLRVLALNQATFAKKVFGEDRVNLAVERVAGVLQEWGY